LAQRAVVLALGRRGRARVYAAQTADTCLVNGRSSRRRPLHHRTGAPITSERIVKVGTTAESKR